MSIPRLLLTAAPSPLLLGELYCFPAQRQISQYLRIHHLTLIPFKRIGFDRFVAIETIEMIAIKLSQMQGQSPRDITNVIELVGGSKKTFLPALIDCANSLSIWRYMPPKVDQVVLRKMGWNF